MKSTQSVCRFSKSSSIAKLGTIIAESYLRERERHYEMEMSMIGTEREVCDLCCLGFIATFSFRSLATGFIFVLQFLTTFKKIYI